MRRVWQYDFRTVGNWKIWRSLSVLSVLKKARPLFTTVYPRAGVGAANQGTASNNLALRQSYRLDVGQSESVGARGNFSVAKRGSKSFRKYKNGRSENGKISFHLLGWRYTETNLS